jgi:glycogen debranching enzyme
VTEGPLSGGGPVVVTADGGVVTLVDGSTFCLSSATGDVVPGGAQGLFFRDARVLSRFALRLDGAAPQPLAVVAEESYGARFVLRATPRRHAGTLLLTRERLVADGLREVLTLENLAGEEATAVVFLRLGADFADLFAVKAGRGAGGEVPAAVEGGALVFAAPGGDRGLRVSGSADAVAEAGGLTWRVVLPARGAWSAEVTAQPVVEGRAVPPGFVPGKGPADSRPAHRLAAWRGTATAIGAGHPALAGALRRGRDDLGTLRIRGPSGERPVVAAGAPWFMTVFGRDSLLTAYMALPLDVSLALGTLDTLARFQGRRVDPATEEEPGRILHEVRSGPERFRALGGSHYYGTVDATPLFVLLLAEAYRWGAPEAAVRALLPAADAALAWMDGYGDRDGDGFLEYCRATDRGLLNQGWKDSPDGINDAAGRPGRPPLALCEVQGYAYAARLGRAALAEAFGDPEAAARLRAAAARLRTTFAERFWLPERGWYAVALDGDKRALDALTSNAAHCLWSGIAPDEHAAVLVERLAADAMDTGYGLRTLAAGMGAYDPVSYHNGSVWPHDTALAVAGLMRYAHVPGAVPLAHHLAEGIVAAAGAFGGRLPELYCGFPRDRFSPPVPYPTSCSPQAWASAAPFLLVRALLGLDLDVPGRRLVLAPRLPESWGTVTLDGLGVGGSRVLIDARGSTVRVDGLPSGWIVAGAPGAVTA